MFTVFGFYKFKKIKDLKKLKNLFESELLKNNVRGTIILSSEGINGTLAGKKNLIQKIVKLKEYGEILIEKYIPGREIQVAILNGNILGAIELKPKRKFYDYEAKYNPKAKTQHIIPINLPKSKYLEVTNIALKAHKVLKCRGVSRSDFRFYKNKFYLLETNTQPGMTSLSLVPEIAKFNNITFKNLIEKILQDASIKK